MKRTASLRSLSGDSGTTGRCGFAKMSIPATRKRLDSLGVAASLHGSSSISWVVLLRGIFPSTQGLPGLWTGRTHCPRGHFHDPRSRSLWPPGSPPSTGRLVGRSSLFLVVLLELAAESTDLPVVVAVAGAMTWLQRHCPAHVAFAHGERADLTSDGPHGIICRKGST